MIGRLNVRKTVFCCGFNVNCEYTDLTGIKLKFLFWMLLSYVLIKKPTVAIYFKLRNFFILFYEITSFFDRTKLMWFYAVAL